MSSIEKLSIRGIRSFSPNREEIIEFYHPLTVILGDNGCGKTTIIECLKISCTGSLPPGARGGQSFVHDPKIAGTNEVKASIRLRFRNCAGKAMVVQRTYQLLQTKAKLQFKAMDGVIRVVNDLGEKVSMSHKCGELDRHIPEVLGVSKAILESVIFCHQEESNWPLQEGAELKKRFDAIFESARYTKALEAIRKLRKSRNTDTKDFKRDLDILSVKMKSADAIRDKIDAAGKKLASVLEETEQATENLERAEETLAEMEQLMADIREQEMCLDRTLVEVQQKEEGVERAYKNIEQMMSDADEELESLLNNYDEIIIEHQKAFHGLQSQEFQLMEQKSAAQNTYVELFKSKGVVEEKVKAKQRLMSELLDMAGAFGTKYNVHVQPLSSQDEELQSFLSKFKCVVQQKQTVLNEFESATQKAEDALNEEISVLTGKQHHAKEGLKSKQREQGVINQEKRDNAAKLKELSRLSVPSQRDVAELERVIEEAEKSVQTYKDQHDSPALESEIQALNRKVLDTNYEIEQLSGKVKLLRIHERDQISLDSKRADCQNKRDDLNAKLAEKASEFQEVLAGCGFPIDSDSLAGTIRHVDNLVIDRKRDYELKKKELSLAEGKLQENMMTAKLVEKSLASLRLEKNELERNQLGTMRRIMEEILPGDDLKNAEHGLEVLEKAYFDAKDKTMRCKNTITFLNIFKKNGENDKCCPLCLRGMNEGELNAFKAAINDKTDDNKVRDKINKSEAQEKTAHDKWKDMEKCMPSWRKWIRLETQIPEKSSELDEIYATQRSLQTDVKDKKYQYETVQRQFEDAQKAQRDFAVLGDAAEESMRLKHRIDEEERRLRSLSTDMIGSAASSLTDVQAALDDKQAELQELNRQLQRKQTELQRNQGMLQQLQNDLHNKKEDKVTMVQQRKDYDAAIEEQQKLRDREKTLRETMLDETEAEMILERDLRAKLQERESRRADAAAKQKNLRAELQQHQGDLRTFSDKLKHVQASSVQDFGQELQRLGQQITQTKQKQVAATQALNDLTPQIATARQNLDQQETFKRHIRDNLEYRKLERDLDLAKGEIDLVRQKLNNLPAVDDVSKRIHGAKAAVSEAQGICGTLKGRKQQLNEQIREYKIQLRQSEFKNIEGKYRKKLIEFETTTMAVADLDKYYRALDQSLIEYHSKKIEEINTIIRSLWQITYKGQDIDSIEIVSGPENGSAAAMKATR
uniref:Rad50/SbcC-type AAA domain-containing protein n=1 Tax=Globisporangium ultimum (strain ATCC 200006 / CBS 805.95 / DAOM BR144) TaxID=431595 RepID=K3WA27_GLOUD